MIRKIRLTLILLLIKVFIPGILLAQVAITGIVTDSKDQTTLPGVTIVEKNTSIGAITDIDGKYSITVPKNAVLVFSFVGYKTQEFTIGNQTVINVVLEEQTKLLDEVIVIGYGVQKKNDKTGAVAQIKSEEMSGGVVTDAIQTIQGKMAGVLVSKKGGDPNEGFSVRIRGAAGFETNTQPLYVIDGVPGVDPSTVAPEDIETFNILKDAASAAIYGSQGANGVILINTKKGSKGDLKIQLNTKVSADQVSKKYDVLNASDIRKYAQGLLDEALLTHPNYTIDSVFNDGGANTDWQDEIFRTGITQSYNLGFSGGTEKSTYYASITQANWEGVLKGTSKERTIAKVNLSHKGLNDRLTLSGSISQTFEKNDYENYDGWDKDDIIYQALTRNPTDPVYDENGDYDKTQRVFNYENPVAVIEQVENTRDFKSFLGSFKADLEIFEGLVGSVNMGYNQDDYESDYFRPNGIYASADNGYGKRQYENEVRKLIDITGNYVKSFNDNHNINILLGYSWQEKEVDGFFAQATNSQSTYLGTDNLRSFLEINHGDIQSWRRKESLIGFFGRIQYNFKNKYYISGSLRRDGSSKFGSESQWGWFPTAAIGYNIHEESFIKNLDIFNQLKLRFSYGVSGNQEFGSYQSISAQSIEGIGVDPETGNDVLIFKQAWASNPNLQWEQTTEYNLGIDFAILNTRVNGSLDFYYKLSDKMLGQFPADESTNENDKMWGNDGKLLNKGIELFIQAFAIDRTNLKWKTSLNFSYNKSEFLDLGKLGELYQNAGFISGRGLVGEENYVQENIVGEEIGTFSLPVYVTMQDGTFIFKSKTGGYTDKLSDAQRFVVGSAAPNYEIGWSNNFTFFKNITLDINFRAWLGNEMYNATEMFLDSPDLPSLNAYPSALNWDEQGRVSGPTVCDMYVEDASFLKLDYLELGYNFKLKKSKWLDNLKVYFASNNVFTITGYSGIDPETKVDGTSFGIDYFNVYPKTRTYTFGINTTF